MADKLMYSRAGLSTGASHARTPPTHGHGNGRPCGPRLQAFRQSDSEQPGPWRTADLILPFAFRFGRGRTHGPCRLQQEEQEPSRETQVPARRGGRFLRGLSCSPPFVRRWDTLLYILLLPPVLHHHHQHNDAVLIMRPAWPIDRRNDRPGWWWRSGDLTLQIWGAGGDTRHVAAVLSPAIVYSSRAFGGPGLDFNPLLTGTIGS